MALNKLLYCIEPSSESLWEEARKHVNLKEGVLVLDDATLDIKEAVRNYLDNPIYENYLTA